MSHTLQSTLGWRLTRHARAAAVSRGFTVEEVLMAAADPDLRYTSYVYGEEPQCGASVTCVLWSTPLLEQC